MKELKAFRIVAILEGVSYILLLFIATPIKYLMHNETFVKILGMPHGIFFLLYIGLALYINADMKWTKKELALVLVASIIPFGTFYIDRKYLKGKS